MENKIKMIVLEGHDMTGKDTLLNMLKSNERFIVFQGPTYEEQGVDKKDKEAYKQFLMRWIRHSLDEIYTLVRDNKDKIVVLSRLWLSDNVFSDLYNRDHVVEKYFLNEIKTNFDVYNFVILWKDYQEYVDRMIIIHQPIEFDEYEFNKITNKFNEYISFDKNFLYDYICRIFNDTSKEYIYHYFINYISLLWK